ncbi:hypothetical protein [Marinimicrobium sp. C2-29]|uniref:hypothetical protein n=1 Tax=Marinimicrobium sp. C2-29 TaxID=3139825 RepID=UPI003138D065
MKPKWIIISATCISIALAVALGKPTFVKGEITEKRSQGESLGESSAVPIKEPIESRRNIIDSISRNNLIGVNLDGKIRIEDSTQEVKDFIERQGYGIQFGESSYQYYPTDTLRDLTESGDFVASHILAKNYWKRVIIMVQCKAMKKPLYLVLQRH